MIWTRTDKTLVVGGVPRLNLLPAREVERRARRGLWRRWMRVAYSAFITVVIEVAFGANWAGQLASEQSAEAATSAQLQSELAGYSPVIEVSSNLRSLEAYRAQAGSNDQDWSALMADIKAVLPPGVVLIGFKLAPGASPVPGAEASAQVGVKGTLTFSANATSAQAQTVTRLRTVGTVIDVDAGELSADGAAGHVTFVTSFSADQTRYTGRFAPSGGK
ncbi:MAG TPA: hypothetical protein VGK18_13140 [Propionicimonas sp.]|jgi:hypothetical protein|uniref:hypothetical protein n=1 Tax=Propionicimonas sp. TaxID=1955623 RepID=UPI002F3F49DC